MENDGFDLRILLVDKESENHPVLYRDILGDSLDVVFQVLEISISEGYLAQLWTWNSLVDHYMNHLRTEIDETWVAERLILAAVEQFVNVQILAFVGVETCIVV